jgi:urate oxidase
MKIIENRYGKSRVRVARIVRQKDHHDFHELTIGIQIEGDFDSSYVDGDNTLVLPTDTMKNTVYALATDSAIAQPESFGLLLARHFLDRNAHVTRARIDLAEHIWQRHGRFSFVAGGAHRRIARVDARREQTIIESGVAGLVLLKTTGSAFEGFLKDEYTTLKETSDRILSTSLDALWRYSSDDVSWSTSWHGVMKLIVDTFAEHDSKSVQHTLYAVGEAVLAQCEHIENIRLTMPNKHYLPREQADVFCPTDEPHGQIEAVISR